MDVQNLTADQILRAAYPGDLFSNDITKAKKEWQKLSKFNISPKVYVDPSCLVTIPHDMIINQMVEDHRGDKKHGSCGVGFNETIERNLNPKYKLQVKTCLM